MDSGTDELFLHCLSGRRDAQSGGKATPSPVSRQPSSDWSEVVEMAVNHGLAPLIYRRLKEGDARAHVPADAWEQLRLHYFVNAERSARLFRELRPVLRCLRSASIPVIVLKGAYLAEAVYGDDALRPMCDVDLMVPRAASSRAHAALLDVSYVRRQPEDTGLHPRRSRELRLPVGAGIDLSCTIDVPGGRSRLDSTGFWDRARPATIAGVEVLALSPEDLLLHLCLHASFSHGLEFGMRPLCDIAETIRRFRSEMDWVQVAERAHEWIAARYVGLMLHLARSMLGAGVPDAVLEQLVPGGIDQRILETTRESVLAKTGYVQRMPLFGRLGARSFGDKTKLSWERVFLSRGEMAAVYPASRDSKYFYFYYALRLRDVVRAYRFHAEQRRVMRSPRRDRNAVLVDWLSGESQGRMP